MIPYGCVVKHTTDCDKRRTGEKMKTKTIIKKTIFGVEGKMILKIDGIIKKEVSGDKGQYVYYDTGFFIKIVDTRVGSDPVVTIFTPTIHALAMASHIIDRLNGTQSVNFEATTDRDKKHSIRAGAFDAGYGVMMSSGVVPIFIPLNKVSLRGLAETIKVMAHICEHFAVVAKMKSDERIKNEQ